MNNQHPNDRQLQRYLNKTCTEIEFRKTGKHMEGCLSCRNRLYMYLEIESALGQMPLLPAPRKLEDRIMNAIYTGSGASEKPPESKTGQKQLLNAVNRQRSELFNGLIAVAATFIFVNSGILGKIMSINAFNWGEGVQNQVAVIESVVTRISIQFLS